MEVLKEVVGSIYNPKRGLNITQENYLEYLRAGYYFQLPFLLKRIRSWLKSVLINDYEEEDEEEEGVEQKKGLGVSSLFEWATALEMKEIQELCGGFLAQTVYLIVRGSFTDQEEDDALLRQFGRWPFNVDAVSLGLFSFVAASNKLRIADEYLRYVIMDASKHFFLKNKNI